ncbi:MAG: type II toxin-antitoxin system VapC family toxin [Deltaproteobacteria bacterium]|nr:type II toxin-antitoxin system VapC family toxin [Deltaproteobacteria bacterium]
MAEVIDASIAIKWFVEEKGREEALEILSQIMSHPQRFCVPELFYFELAHVLNRVLGPLNSSQKRLYEKTLHLGMKRFLMTQDMHLSICEYQAMGLSGYDAAYVAVAKHTSGIWVTFDAKAHKLIRSLGLSRCLS